MRFRPNTVLRSSALNALGELAERQRLQGAAAGQYNNGVGVVVRNPRRMRMAASPPQAWPVLCRITFSGIDGYVVQVYAAGPGAAPTSTAVLNAVEIGDMDLLPVGTWLLGFPGVAAIYEGND